MKQKRQWLEQPQGLSMRYSSKSRPRSSPSSFLTLTVYSCPVLPERSESVSSGS